MNKSKLFLTAVTVTTVAVAVTGVAEASQGFSDVAVDNTIIQIF